MTRINSAIRPIDLMDKHLVAELHELPRVFTHVSKRLEEGKGFKDIPIKFSLGTGHVTFFYDKLYFIERRFYDLREEYWKRYAKIWNYSIEGKVPQDLDLYKDYKPTTEEKSLLVERISERIWKSRKDPLYYRTILDKSVAVQFLNRD